MEYVNNGLYVHWSWVIGALSAGTAFGVVLVAILTAGRG